MNAKQANEIPIREYLKAKGIIPVRSYKNYALYKSPYRLDQTASLKVDHRLNLWVDFGDNNQGGTLIDLVLKMNPGYTITEAIGEIEKTIQPHFSFQQQINQEINDENVNIGEKEKSIRITKVQELGSHPAITAYLHSRGIELATAKPFCKELYYTLNEQRYFGIGNENDNGWSIRNKYWKGCSGQGVSHYAKGNEKLAIFEGLFDLLSYMELNQQAIKTEDFLVLNSLVNLHKAHDILETYKSISLFLDHDTAGRKATCHLLKTFPQSRDGSGFYKSRKDLNEYYLVCKKENLIITKRGLRAEEASHVLARPKRLLR